MYYLLLGVVGFLIFGVFTGNLAVVRGFRRLLGTIAFLWFLFALYRAFATGSQASPGMHELIFLWPLYIYGFGWLLTFIACGFQPKRIIAEVLPHRAEAVSVARHFRSSH